MDLPSLPRKFLGIPYEWGGRSFEGCDCYGLAVLYYEHEMGIRLPMLSELQPDNEEDREARAAAVKGSAQSWIEIPHGDTHQRGELVVLDDGEGLGVYLGTHRGLMLLTQPGGESVVCPVWGLRWRHRVLSFYRYPSA